MPGGLVLVSNGVSSHMIPDRIFLPCQVAYGKTSVPSISFARGQELFLGPNISCSTSIASYTRSLPLLCKASSNKRYLDFSRLYKGSSRGMSGQNQEREKSDNLDDNLLSSKNGPLVSPTSKQRPSATVTPEQRKEIIELFRKVQAQLRERAAKKKEMKIEGAQQGDEKDRVRGGPFLKLQTLTQGRNRGSEDGYDLDQPLKFDSFDHPEPSDPFELEQNSSFFEPDNLSTEDGVQEPKPIPSSRPFSSFKRKSPVTKVQYQPVLSAVEDVDGKPSLKSNQKPKPDMPDIELQTGHLGEDNHERTTFESFCNDWVVTSHLSDSSDTDETNKEISESCLGRGSDLYAMTVSELRSLAKSRGIKGYSKLKKTVLLELLTVEHS